MNNPFAREPEPSEGYDDLTFSDFPSTSYPAPSSAGQTIYADFRGLGPAGGSALQHLGQQPLSDVTRYSYSPMPDQARSNAVAFEYDWAAIEEDGQMEQVIFKPASLWRTSSFDDPNLGPDEFSTGPSFTARSSERYAPYHTNVPEVYKDGFADTTPTATLEKPSERSSLGESPESDNDSDVVFIRSRRRRGMWHSVLKSATHSKTVYPRGHLGVAPLYVIDDDGIVPSVDSLAAFAREYGPHLKRWGVAHLSVQLDNPTDPDAKYERRKARELYCGEVLSNWYIDELQTANHLDPKRLESWSKLSISQVFVAKAETRLAALFSWDRLKDTLTRFGTEAPERSIDGWRVTFSERP